MKTLMTEMLGIEHPIMQGGMQWLGVPTLAAAVSNAGGIGTINASCYPDPDEFRAAIKETKRLTKKPFAVNLSLTPEATIGEKTADNIKIAGKEGVKVIETAGRRPDELRELIHNAGMVHIHKCTALRHAIHAQKVGVDMVTMIGYEGAGHPGPDETSTFVLTSECCQRLSIPVLAAGGIADGRGMLAAMAMGAEGIVMGTRFVASEECWIHDNFKQVIVNADERATITCQRNINNMCRYYRNAQSEKALALEKANASLEETLKVVSGRLGYECYQSGDTEGCCFSIGETAALIHEIKPVKRIIEDIINEAEGLLVRYNRRAGLLK